MTPVQPLFENRHFTATLLRDEPIVLLVRTSVPFSSPLDATRACLPLMAALAPYQRQGHRLLLDSREAVGNNDPEYETWFARFRRELIVGFQQTAVVVQTHVGTLQTQRLLTADGARAHAVVFNALSEALAFLRRGLRHERRSTPVREGDPTSSPLARSAKAHVHNRFLR